MKKGNIVLIIILVVLLIITIFLGYKLKVTGDKYEENKSLYCVTGDNTNDKIELYFDFKDGKAYRYTQVFTNEFKPEYNLDSYKQLIEEENKYKSVIAKIWNNDKVSILTEVFDLDEKNKDELKEFNFDGLIGKTRKEIMNNGIETYGDNLKCE